MTVLDRSPRYVTCDTQSREGATTAAHPKRFGQGLFGGQQSLGDDVVQQPGHAAIGAAGHFVEAGFDLWRARMSAGASPTASLEAGSTTLLLVMDPAQFQPRVAGIIEDLRAIAAPAGLLPATG